MDEKLLSALAEIASAADASGEADVPDISSPEYRELKRLGMFDEASEYMDATARVRLSYAALRAVEESETATAAGDGGGRGLAGRVASVLGSFFGAAAKEFME